LGVEHGDYNGTELFGIGTDRFIWFLYKANGLGVNRLYSLNFADEGVVEYRSGDVPVGRSAEVSHSWARFAYGVDHVLRKAGCDVSEGVDGVIYGNIPGGGMSRSASLTLNLILSFCEANGVDFDDDFSIVELAQQVENEYIGSPCGLLDQVMIYFARAGQGVYYKPGERAVEYVPIGAGGEELRFVVLDTGTTRAGLEKSTYSVRRAECEKLVSLLRGRGYEIGSLADIHSAEMYEAVRRDIGDEYPELCRRLDYIYNAGRRFYEMLDAWRGGDIEALGRIFRADGFGLRDDYEISGPELEAMCEIARGVDGVLGERMLGGGDKGASGALVRAGSVESLRRAVTEEYPRRVPDYADKFAVHVCRSVDGICAWDV
jgi:galactokinase